MFDNKKGEKLESMIGPNTSIEGNVNCKGTLRLDGRLVGNVEADWVILGEKSYLKGNVNAAGIIVAGHIDGNLAVKEIIEVRRTGQVKGDIVTSKLVVIEGGIIDGRLTMQHRDEIRAIELDREEARSVN